MKVADVMTVPVHTVSSGKSVWHASRVMADLRIGSLVVMDAGQVTGIITSRDVRAAHPNRIVADAMTPDPVSVPMHAFLWDALRTMEQEVIERLIVVQDDQIAGIVTRESLVTKLAEWNDSMTKMYRSPYIHAIGEELLARGEPFQLLFVDLNRFGEVNKQFGHPVGDDMIRGFADKLRSLFGPEDFICRYAGDEFTVITMKSDSTVRQLIEELSDQLIIGKVSISADVGWVNERNEPEFFQLPLRELISRASLLSTKAKLSIGR
ncbi:CBS domain-containing protein [Cohnella silvisoli]|uniref:GGDEF domain-containing protein n=1 Tax=Cohnella silvisoli TaxID=2873699 RepID=A0ABV1L030_9BACL|nr:GGDEF domain-containing protein [Cohnella silvisoli]MCD9024952.1 GGDEF domain-containing protein [Cohnella silvisoli]